MMDNHYLLPDWPAPAHVKAYSTLRGGEFNLATPASRQQLVTELGLTQAPVWLQQVHGNTLICLDHPHEAVPVGDASYATRPHQGCVVMTADCLPVLICDRQGTKVAAIHCGWRGLAAHILEKTLMQLNIPAADTLVWLGPAIGPAAFEVGEEVRTAFLASNPQLTTAFEPGQMAGKWHANLWQIATLQLQQHHISAIYGGGWCTYSDPQRFFSYRRDEGKTGRMATLIWLTR